MDTELIVKAASKIEAVANSQAELSERMARIQADLIELQQKGVAALGGMQRKAADPLAALFQTTALRDIARKASKSASFALETGVRDLLVKSALIEDVGGSDGAGWSTHPNRLNVLGNDPRRRLSLLDALPRIPVTSSSINYNSLDGYTNQADFQSEQGGLKAEASVPTELRVAHIATIAHHLPVSEQLLADEPMLRAALDSLLRHGLALKTEAELINGAGATGEIAGFTHATNYTAYTPTSGDNLPDAVGRASVELEDLGWEPNLVLCNSADWQAARSQREGSAGDGAYLVGDWSRPPIASIWGVPAIPTPSLQAGKFIVMDRSQALLLDRMMASVEVGRIDDQFTRNLVTIRAEVRVGLAVLSQTACLYGDFSA